MTQEEVCMNGGENEVFEKFLKFRMNSKNISINLTKQNKKAKRKMQKQEEMECKEEDQEIRKLNRG